MIPYRVRRSAWAGPIALVCFASAAGAIDLDVNAAKIDAALSLARADEPVRLAFHKPYILTTSAPIIERLEIVTEFRRLVRIAEDRIANGDRFFARNMIAAQDAIQPFRQRVSVVVRLRFHPQNAYVVGPPIDVSLFDQFEPVARLDLMSETLFGFASGEPKQQLPVVGAITEAVFDATVVGQNYRTIVVRVDGKDIARVTTDFGRVE